MAHAITSGRAVVIGCGGVLGIAWTVGLINALQKESISFDEVDSWIGASAGAVVAAKLACKVSADRLYEEQTSGVAAAGEVYRAYSQAEVNAKNQVLFEGVSGDLVQARRRIGAWASRTRTPTLTQRCAIIEGRLGDIDWPQTPLLIVCVDVHTGEPKVWTRSDAVPLLDAVAASCAVPGVWPPVPLQGSLYMDGGLRSMTNADLAIGAECVLVFAPLGYSEANPISGHLRTEISQLEAAGSRVLVAQPDAGALDAMGGNILDPSRCSSVAQAGLRQGRKLVDKVAEFWDTPQPVPTNARKSS